MPPLITIVYPGNIITRSGGTVRALAMARALKQTGFELTLVSRDINRSELLALGLFNKIFLFKSNLPIQLKANATIPSYIIRSMDIEFNNFAREAILQNPPLAVICHYAWTAGIFAELPPNILSILDTIDIQFKRTATAHANGVTHFDRQAGKNEELRELRKAQVIVAIQPDERTILQQLIPERHVICATHSPKIKPLASPESSRSILFVGSNYDPNIRGIERFILEAWPDILKNVPKATIDICGKVCESLGNYQNTPGLKLHYETDNLELFYKQAAVVINPSLYGTGLPIKTSEALGYGKSLVCNQSSARGFDKETFPGIICDYSQMSKHIIPMLENIAERRRIEETTASCATQHLTPKLVFKELITAIQEHSDNASTAIAKTQPIRFIAKFKNYPLRKLFYYYVAVLFNRLFDFNASTKGEKGGLLAKYIQLRWHILACKKNIRRAAICGAGKHTCWLEWVLRDEDTIEITAVLDDRPNASTVLFGKQPVPLVNFDPSTVDAIILSSDCIQDKLAARCREVYGDKVRLINLYEGLPPGPYAK